MVSPVDCRISTSARSITKGHPCLAGMPRYKYIPRELDTGSRHKLQIIPVETLSRFHADLRNLVSPEYAYCYNGTFLSVLLYLSSPLLFVIVINRSSILEHDLIRYLAKSVYLVNLQEMNSRRGRYVRETDSVNRPTFGLPIKLSPWKFKIPPRRDRVRI